jgi:hypothetical protein
MKSMHRPAWLRWRPQLTDFHPLGDGGIRPEASDIGSPATDSFSSPIIGADGVTDGPGGLDHQDSSQTQCTVITDDLGGSQ